MYDTSQFRKGLKVEVDGEPWIIVDFQHVKPGKGNQFTRTKLKNLITGYVIDRTYKSGEKVGIPDVEASICTFLYANGDTYHFMDQKTYDQHEVHEDSLGDVVSYLIEDLKISLLIYQGRPVNIEVPTFVNLEVTQSEPGVKGDTASGGTKPATMSTGLVVQVPFHINEGDVLKIDTRNGAYVERVSRG